MRKIIAILLLVPLMLMGIGFDPNDKNKIEILRHFDIPASFLRDPSLHDVYSQKKRDTSLQGFDDASENANLLLPMLSSLIAQSDLPNEFLYVVLAESQLEVDSTSSHGAAGLWQFMETTGKLQGLQVNQYVDERRDHIKSTRAAIAYLSSLKKQFGKWYLALIAYNCGDGRLTRAIQKAGTTDLNVLADPKRAYIPHESRNYIRTVVALAFLGSEDPYLSQFTSTQEAVENPIATVYLPKGEKIDRIAAVLEMPKTKLISLNTHLKKGVTPPNAQSYPVYIPKEKLEAFQQKFQPKDIQGYFIMHRVKSGETLDQLSKRYNVPKNSIMMENMIGDNEDRNLNRRVKIPITKPFLKNPRLYTAKSGETLASVAALYNTTIEQLKLKNPFASNVLKEGEEIKVAD
ncbi:lytic transglycosylase domain-containing protein [Sulfuricurvum sp.]|uniref:lytic transglycosylase domain-containing protein n=1 Tax=Sulfuricurvum sp. TaxID=2025608 RepID=UPI00262FF707|nr:lytic transglycosylase domain-containing protein [Sulfuricurvum sp.]MDD2267348.1 transglycosylase SLT domain-containing protein [Sulfuricurvum sp.]MDD2784315.1 transglycosylase SLT domain-containing protein [Sulfuricurvum sp.]